MLLWQIYIKGTLRFRPYVNPPASRDVFNCAVIALRPWLMHNNRTFAFSPRAGSAHHHRSAHFYSPSTQPNESRSHVVVVAHHHTLIGCASFTMLSASHMLTGKSHTHSHAAQVSRQNWCKTSARAQAFTGGKMLSRATGEKAGFAACGACMWCCAPLARCRDDPSR